jgi:hypothetical protein
MGIFAELQPIYAEHNIPTFPVEFAPDGRKKPATSRYDKIGIKGSAKIAGRLRFSAHDTFGFQLGRRSNITILDVDTPDEKVLTGALDRHGPSPLIVRTGSGKYHAYYRHQGEPRAKTQAPKT